MGKGKIRIEKKVLVPERIRGIRGGFGFIPHRFLTDGFIAQLGHNELLLYFFLALVSDRQGLSFYSYGAICSLLELGLDEYIDARDGLIHKDLIAFDGTLFQVLELPEAVVKKTKTPRCPVVARQIRLSLTEAKNGH
jgi:hypothetical protein